MEYTFKSIKEWAVEDRPREKMLAKGMDALTDAELIAILLATGSKECSALDLARKMVQEIGSIEKLARADTQTLTTIKGIGTAKAVTLMAAFELGRRKAKEQLFETQITSSELAAHYLMNKIGDSEQEKFYVLFLDRKNAIKEEKMISIGGISSTVIDVRVVFQAAIKCLASGIIVSHNHPSGNLQPSEADKAITQKLVEGAKLFDIAVLDHVIVSSKAYYSFADNGMLSNG
ncbi:MAG: DNA repair protein RadC [Bacteroidia bacterium]